MRPVFKLMALLVIAGVTLLLSISFLKKDMLLQPPGQYTGKYIMTAGEERLSPYDHIKEEQIKVYPGYIRMDIANTLWARFLDSNSMDPVIDTGANAIQIVPESEQSIHVGDIVSYSSIFVPQTLIHRVVEIGEDEHGWYAYLKGDNNLERDPGRIRFSQVKSITVSVVY
jgi:hypothetical protein